LGTIPLIAIETAFISASLVVQVVVLLLLLLILFKVLLPSSERLDELGRLPDTVVREVREKLDLATEIARVKVKLDEITKSLTEVGSTSSRIEESTAKASKNVTQLDNKLALRADLENKEGVLQTLAGIFVGFFGAVGVDWIIHDEFVHLNSWIARFFIVFTVLIIVGWLLPGMLFKILHRGERSEIRKPLE
jgi:hypothetical protein